MSLTWLELTIYGLACLRLAIFWSSDAGPWGFASRFRSFLKREAKTNKPLRDSKVHIGVSCIRCESIWFGIAIAAYAHYHDSLADWFKATGDAFLLCMALSCVAIILNRAFPAR